ncbi:MAG: hypothetical protein ACYC3N_00380 [Halothiobacillus sp.]
MRTQDLLADKALGLVEQDAAIDDYLNGLLREDAATEQSRTAVKLSLVGTLSAPQHRHEPLVCETQNPVEIGAVVYDDLPQESITHAPADDLLFEIPERAVSPDAIGVSVNPVLTADPVTAQTRDPVAKLNDEQTKENAAYFGEAFTHEMSPERATEQRDRDEVVFDKSTASPWRVFAVGAIKIAIPKTEIMHVLHDVTLRPISGAPSSIAGAVDHEGRSCLVLSLPTWLPPVKTAAHVLLLGVNGLWGLCVGEELPEITWNDAQTTWRDTTEQNSARPGLAGVNRDAGLVFIEPSALRSTLRPT